MGNKKKNSNYLTKSKQEQMEATAAKEISDERKRKITNYTVTAVAVILVASIIAILAAAPWKYIAPDLGEGGASEYLTSRDTADRDVSYVKIDVKGYGSIVVLLDATTAPVTVANFLKLVDEGFYDGLTFHRAVENFMIQGGDPSADGTGGSDEEIKGEFSANGHDNDMPHIKGVISMARSSKYDSASSQFFICNATNSNVTNSLDGKYAAFGYVVAGLDIIDEITSFSIQYADAESGTIYDKSRQIIIKKITVLDNYGN